MRHNIPGGSGSGRSDDRPGLRSGTGVTTESVRSRDGTAIGYLRQGSGPGVVLVQGAMADVHAYRDLAAALARTFTVHTAERRGRGLSPKPYDPGHDITRDVEDLEAILVETGASYLFGLSSGAVIALEAARTLDQVLAVAVYEPPLQDRPVDDVHLGRLEDDLRRGRAGAAFVGAVLAARTAPRLLGLLPRPVLALLARAALTLEGRRPGPQTSLRDLLPGVRYDFHVVRDRAAGMHALSTLAEPVLLLSGTRSPVFLQQCVRDLLRQLPDGRHTVLEGLGHDGPWNHDRGGQPGAVAAELTAFFTAIARVNRPGSSLGGARHGGSPPRC